MAGSDRGTPREGVARDDVRTEPMPRRVYGGRYSVEEELGRGGMGRVLRARDLKIGRAVALKILPAGQHGEEQRLRFEQEARAAGALNHPNILAVYDVGEHAGEPYIVAELLEGETLRGALSTGPMVPNEVLELGIQLASGLAAAHRKGIVHRDLKPENLFVTDEGRLKILDFGIAKLLPEARKDGPPLLRTDTGAVLGTPAYMSPEQVRGEPADAHSDVFACGAVLYEMLSGTSPFIRANGVDTGHAILHQAPPALPPGPLSRIVEHCLEKDPAARYADAGGILDDLNAIVRGERIAAWRRSRRRVTAIAAAMLASAIGMFLLVRLYVIPRRLAAAKGAQVVAVLPFTVRGTGQNAYLGEGMVDLLSTTMNSQAVRAVDPHALLSALNRERWNADPESGRKLASRFGAKQFVLGTVVEVGSRLRIHASLYDAEQDDAALRDAKVEGDATKIFDLVDDLSAQLRGSGGKRPAGERMIRLAEVTTTSAPALRAYIEGLQEARRLRGDAARAAFERAIAADPSFALGHQLLSETAASNGEFELAFKEAERALDLGKQLPEQDQLRIRAWSAFMHGKYEEAKRLSEQIVRAHPDGPDLLLQQAYVPVVYGHIHGVPWVEAMDLFARAMPLNPIGLRDRLVAGRLEEAVAFVDRLLKEEPSLDQATRVWAQWTRAVISGDREQSSRLREQRLGMTTPEGGYFNLEWYFGNALYIPGGLAEAESLAKATLDSARSVYNQALGHEWLSEIARTRGRLVSAREELAASLAAEDDPNARLSLAGFSALVPYAPADSARLAADRRAVESFVDRPDNFPLLKYRRLMLLGRLAALMGDAASAEGAARELDAATVGPEGSTLGADWALWVRATLAWSSGRTSDALGALERIRGEVPMTVPWYASAWPEIRWARGELLFSLGRADEAARWFLTGNRFDRRDFMAPRFRRLAQIEEKRGNRKSAIDYYKRFIELWKDPDPGLRPQVEEAKARLAALR